MPIQKKTLPAFKTFKKSDAQQALEENVKIEARQVELEAAMEKGLIKKYAESDDNPLERFHASRKKLSLEIPR